MVNRWSQFNKNTAQNPPRDLYLDSAKLVSATTPLAIDIAAGALNETKDMLARGFRVVALDSNPDILKLGKTINDDRLQIVLDNMENYNYGEKKYDFAVAMFALPFIKPSQFAETFHKITASLRSGGIFAFHLFGVDDDWSNNPEMTFHDKVAAHNLVEGLEVVKLREIHNDGATSDGKSKHWHIFQVIVRKK